jgi:hypothetical protein
MEEVSAGACNRRLTLLPTPSRPHYTFNLRDVARIIQGVVRADPKVVTRAPEITALWLHEALRVFGDRLTCDQDRDWLRYDANGVRGQRRRWGGEEGARGRGK